MQMVAVRGGYSLIPLLARDRFGELEGLIAFRLFDDPPPGRMLGLIHRRTSAKANDLRRLADLLRGARRTLGPADDRREPADASPDVRRQPGALA
jgi:LysR family hydrogen peroxide-inducible transcriptional activator